MLDPFFLGSARYAIGVLLFIGILWIAEGRQALRYGWDTAVVRWVGTHRELLVVLLIPIAIDMVRVNLLPRNLNWTSV